MSTLSICDYPRAKARRYFEDDDAWQDTNANRQLLEALNIAAGHSSHYAINALKFERAGADKLDEMKAKAGHWETVAATLEAVLRAALGEFDEKLWLPDPWRHD